MITKCGDFFLFVCEGKVCAAYKVHLKLMASFPDDFDGCKIKPKSQDTENYDLSASLIPLCHCIIPSL